MAMGEMRNRRSGCGRLLAGLLAVCCFVSGIACAAAAGEAAEPGYRVENNILYIDEGIQVLGYLPDDMLAQTEGMVSCPGLYRYTEQYWAVPTESIPVLDRVVLPESLVHLGEGAFYGVRTKSLSLPRSITTIRSRSFADLYAAQVHLHAGVTEWDNYSFTGCEGIEAFTVEAGNPALKAVDGVLFTADGSALLRYPAAKAGEHYDVPAGVTRIAPYAFSECKQLRSVALPMGVASLEWGAFSECVQLETVALPLTLREIEPYAFTDCVSLWQLTIPDEAEVTCDPALLAEYNSYGGEPWKPEEFVLSNTPKLTVRPEWDYYKVHPPVPYEEADGPEQRELPNMSYAILSPENARDHVPIYAKPNTKSDVMARAASGSTVMMVDWQDGWYKVWWRRDRDEGASDGWVRQQDLLLCPSGEPLFQIASVRPKNSGIYGMNNGVCMLPYDEPKAKLAAGTELMFAGVQGQWVSAARPDEEWGAVYLYFYPSDLLYTRRYTGDGLRFGIVMSDDPRDRLNLRQEATKNSKSIGKYYSGTQVQILGELEDWYHVRVDFQDGWMMKEFVQEVPQEQP